MKPVLFIPILGLIHPIRDETRRNSGLPCLNASSHQPHCIWCTERTMTRLKSGLWNVLHTPQLRRSLWCLVVCLIYQNHIYPNGMLTTPLCLTASSHQLHWLMERTMTRLKSGLLNILAVYQCADVIISRHLKTREHGLRIIIK